MRSAAGSIESHKPCGTLWRNAGEVVFRRNVAKCRAADHNAAMSWKTDPATDKQLELIRDLGYFLTPPKTKGDASTLIDALKAGRGNEVAQDRMFRFQAGIPLEPLPVAESSGYAGKFALGCMLLIALAIGVFVLAVIGILMTTA